MGVDYNAVFAVGLEFDRARDAVDFLKEHHALTEDQLEELDDEGDSYISEVSYSTEGFPDVQCLNLYSGDYWYVGFSIQARDVDNLVENVTRAKNNWEVWFPSVDADIIHTVRVS